MYVKICNGFLKTMLPIWNKIFGLLTIYYYELYHFPSYFIKFFEKTLCIDLIENGRNIPVNEENKKDYVKLFCLAKMNKEIRTQTHTLMKGVLEIIPFDLITLLHENELGLVLSGFSTIDGLN